MAAAPDILTWLTYATYYTGRKGFSVAKKAIHDHLGVSVAALGLIDTAYLAAYAIGQFVSGTLGDRIGAGEPAPEPVVGHDGIRGLLAFGEHHRRRRRGVGGPDLVAPAPEQGRHGLELGLVVVDSEQQRVVRRGQSE